MPLPARQLSLALRRVSPLLGLLLGGCGGPAPVYDDELGLQAVSVPPGALAGTFALKTSVITVAELPVTLGEDGNLAGGETYYLVERRWHEDSGAYSETRRVCGGVIYETAGTRSTVTEDRWRLVPDITTMVLTVEHEAGTYAAADHAELWAIDLEDPVGDAMPRDAAEAEGPAFRERVFDADDDGNPGMTMHLEGLATGEVYFCQRKDIDLDGYVVAPDGETLGLVTARFDQVTLGASSPLLLNQLERSPHPDAKEAWFHMQRVADGSGCDEVLKSVESGRLARRNPFR